MSLTSLWPPIGLTVFAWWLSTGLILLLVRLPRNVHTIGLMMYAGGSMPIVWNMVSSASATTDHAVYSGFLAALVLWGWHEASFLMGKITGPRPLPCPPNTHGWRRMYFATATLIYHEIALFVTLLLIAALTWGAPNQIALWTFGALFGLRLSSKFNIFLGVPNLTDEFFPDHLAHLKTYLPKRPASPLMVVSLIIGSATVVWLLSLLLQSASPDYRATALVIVTTLIVLGILEHLFMITPLPDASLWRWAAPKRGDV